MLSGSSPENTVSIWALTVNKTTGVSRTNAEHVADLVGVHVREAEVAKPVGEPRAACRFCKRRRGHACRLHLPERKLRLLRAEPVKCGAHLWRRGEVRYFLLQRRIRIGRCACEIDSIVCAYLITYTRQALEDLRQNGCSFVTAWGAGNDKQMSRRRRRQ